MRAIDLLLRANFAHRRAATVSRRNFAHDTLLAQGVCHARDPYAMPIASSKTLGHAVIRGPAIPLFAVYIFLGGWCPF